MKLKYEEYAVKQIILVCIALLVTGLLRQWIVLRQSKIQILLAAEFLNKFIQWCNGEGRDRALYNWMLSKSEQVQEMTGASGLVNLRKPWESGYHPNVPIILNGLHEIDREYRGRTDWRVIDTYYHMVDMCLRRFIGQVEEQHQREKARTWNPLVLFCAGVAWIMELPLVILSETKVISAGRRDLISSGKAFSVLKGLVTLATLVATVMSIVMHWGEFWNVVSVWLR